MKTYVLDIIPKIRKFSKKLDDLTNLKYKHWVLFDENKKEKVVYIFKSYNELLVLNNGKGSIERWEYIDDTSIQVTISDKIYLYRIGFLDEEILTLKLDSFNHEYSIFLDEEIWCGIQIFSEIMGILNKYLDEIVDEIEKVWKCSKCQEINPDNFKSCWKCSEEFSNEGVYYGKL